ncbi:endogenous retrovirus group 3 member 1 Env polyprotein-like [Notamacropus eugenii]|uniref:endogenous retrovirus group 3 member 1 Env polyprotein-like n=1 Tax=Notamacropus eugenii TaxID=9315 RepID=UPI003B685A85
MNSTKNNTEYKEWVWKWENGTHRMMFDTFWSVINRTGENYQHCIWKRKQQLWRCKSEIMKGGPLGPEDVKYFLAVDYRVRLFLEENPALRGHYWICGQTAYTHLPLNWRGVCYIGLVRPKFFFLPESGKRHLEVPLYDDLAKRKRNIDTSLTQTGNANGWGGTWPPKRIIREYGPTTWAQDESWGYRTPIYLLNTLIRLQAVVEIITNQTAEDLDLLADQATQTREAVLQHRLILDYLLAEEGGVCGKLNLSTCCLKIDDNGRIVKEITKNIRNVTHVPVQTWNSFFNTSWWSCFEGSWWRRLLWFGIIAISGLILLPICLPCLISLITKIVRNSLLKLARVEERTEGAIWLMILKKEG